MSLDVYLILEEAKKEKSSSGIFIRENGTTKEISEQEWNQRNPNAEPVKFQSQDLFTYEAYSDNITHNLGKMAAQAGIYTCLWRPEEIGITKAKQLVQPLKEGLNLLKALPEKFKAFNPENGWGDYDGLVSFVENYLKACVEYPEANVRASR